jgi:hypothetical protein
MDISAGRGPKNKNAVKIESDCLRSNGARVSALLINLKRVWLVWRPIYFKYESRPNRRLILSIKADKLGLFLLIYI